MRETTADQAGSRAGPRLSDDATDYGRNQQTENDPQRKQRIYHAQHSALLQVSEITIHNGISPEEPADVGISEASDRGEDPMTFLTWRMRVEAVSLYWWCRRCRPTQVNNDL